MDAPASKDVWKEYGRLWEGVGITEAGVTPSDSRDLPEWLKELEDVDVSAGIKNCGSAEGYMSVINVFHKTAQAKADEIESLYEDMNIPDYTIRVHALKSSARIIGAAELSKLAEKLEDAGKREDTVFIGDNTKKLLSMYRELDKELSKLDGDLDDKPEIDKDSLYDAYQTIGEIAAGMDFELMEEVLDNLKGFRLDEEDEKNVKTIEKLMTELEWEEIGNLVRRIL